ncbi:DUF6551 family protein [Streptomyces sp. NPDC002308]
MERTIPDPQVELIAPSMVTVDRRVNTRPVDQHWVTRQSKLGYDKHRIGVPTVSARGDGKIIWLDGQNRGALIAAAGRSDEKIHMRVFRSLTVAEEAELFLGLNDNRRVTPMYKFLAEVTAEREEALEISKIAHSNGWLISDSSGSGINAVSSLRKIYRSSNPKGSTLSQTLYIVTKSWGHTPESVNSHILLGIASVINEALDLNPDNLVKKLSAYAGGCPAILTKARGFRSVVGCSVTEGVDQCIRTIYNQGRRSGRLASWGPPAARSANQPEMLQLS